MEERYECKGILKRIKVYPFVHVRFFPNLLPIKNATITDPSNYHRLHLAGLATAGTRLFTGESQYLTGRLACCHKLPANRNGNKHS